MREQLDLSQYKVRTDLAVEAKEMVDTERIQAVQEKKIGVFVQEVVEDGVKITTVDIDENGAKEIGKKQGRYITLEMSELRSADDQAQEKFLKLLKKQLRDMLIHMKISDDAEVFVVGLGNREVTPDAVGPIAIENLMITRHLFELQSWAVKDGYRSVSAMIPGVMGTTGIETSDMIEAVIQKIQPKLIVVIDALASRSIHRVNTTIQITNTGIHPGSGVGNRRKELSQEVYGVPVLAIGVPTVVDAVSITSDTVDYLLKHLGRETKEGPKPSGALIPSGMRFGKKREFTVEDELPLEKKQTFMGLVGSLDEEEKRKLIYEVLAPMGLNFIVTPKEVDIYVRNIAEMIADSLNEVLHSELES